MRIADIFKGKPKRTRRYLIEIRLSGFVKDSMREIKEAISQNFHVSQREIIPHISLVGPIYTNDEKKLVKEVVKIGKKFECIIYWVGVYISNKVLRYSILWETLLMHLLFL